MHPDEPARCVRVAFGGRLLEQFLGPHHRCPERRPHQRPHVYAGIDVTTPLFTGVRGAQLAGRARLIGCAAFPARLGDQEPFPNLVTMSSAC
ncbi:hypothetical protein [Streptomyces sp. BK340]|uniref:hypothetical protein n=1 Tax=Streptomyces sp. BK340 TaxID=2572903 RepID=UPI0011AD70D7|nr:hypothetical protein FB157_14149 [Streptomyces sp. BK340]